MYALITSVNNFGGILGSILGGTLANYFGITATSTIFKIRFYQPMVSQCYI